MSEIIVNGKSLQCEEGEYILKVCRRNNIDIPTLCHHEAVEPWGGCRLCVVEITHPKWPGWKRTVTSCLYPAQDGLVVETDSPEIRETRADLLDLLLARCPNTELVQKLAAEYGVTKTSYTPREDPDDCILCGLCTRVCGELMGRAAISTASRGVQKMVATPFMESPEACISCGACVFVCPTDAMAQKWEKHMGRELKPIPSEFDQGLCGRPAIYTPFPQAVPNVPIIDKNSCVKLLTGGCGACEAFCEPKAIKFDQVDTIEEVDVGAIILATGFKTFDAGRKPQYGYGKYPNVFTSLEVERIVNASGPTGGEVRLRDGRRPKSVAIVHCVGSRDDKTNRWCSRVCCMYSLKLAHLLKERSGADIYNFYIDMRTPGKSYEEFYERLCKEGVQFIRGRAAMVTDAALTKQEEGKLVVMAEDTLVGAVCRIPVDMVVLSVGMEPQTDTEDVRRTFNIGCSSEGWFLERHPKLAPVSTFTDGIFIAGACQGPKDIPDTVAQAGAAAAEAMALIDKGYVQLEPNTAFITEELCSGCKTCVALCPYSAITYDNEKLKAAVNEALCKGCGTCVAACPSGAAQQHLFTDIEVYEEIEGVLDYV